METFFSSIHPSLKRYLIKRSSLFALPGFFLLLYMGIFLSTSSIERWGIWGFALGFALISCGMIPYRRIIRLETKPHCLTFDKERLCFIHSKKGSVQFPIDQIDQFYFVERKGFYGIRLYLRDGNYFLLPYFSKKTFNSLVDSGLNDVMHMK